MDLSAYKNVVDFKNICRTCMNNQTYRRRIDEEKIRVDNNSIPVLELLNIVHEVKVSFPKLSAPQSLAYFDVPDSQRVSSGDLLQLFGPVASLLQVQATGGEVRVGAQEASGTV